VEGDAEVLCVGVQAVQLGHNLDAASAVVLTGLPLVGGQEEPIDWNKVLREMRAAGLRASGDELDEQDLRALWQRAEGPLRAVRPARHGRGAPRAARRRASRPGSEGTHAGGERPARLRTRRLIASEEQDIRRRAKARPTTTRGANAMTMVFSQAAPLHRPGLRLPARGRRATRLYKDRRRAGPTLPDQAVPARLVRPGPPPTDSRQDHCGRKRPGAAVTA
jgi:hypothetical protein